MSSPNIRVSRSKIQALRKDEISNLLNELGISSSGLKTDLETRLLNALTENMDHKLDSKFANLYMTTRGGATHSLDSPMKKPNSITSISSSRSGKSPEKKTSTDSWSSGPSSPFHIASNKPAKLQSANSQKHSPEKQSSPVNSSTDIQDGNGPSFSSFLPFQSPTSIINNDLDELSDKPHVFETPSTDGLKSPLVTTPTEIISTTGFSTVNAQVRRRSTNSRSTEQNKLIEGDDNIQLVSEDNLKNVNVADEKDDEEEDEEDEEGEVEDVEEENEVNSDEGMNNKEADVDESRFSFIGKTINATKLKFEMANSKFRSMVQISTTRTQKWSRKSLKSLNRYTFQLIDIFLNWIWYTRSHLSKISVINSLFLIGELLLLVFSLVINIVFERPIFFPPSFSENKFIDNMDEYAAYSATSESVISESLGSSENMEKIGLFAKEAAAGVKKEITETTEHLLIETYLKIKSAILYANSVFFSWNLWTPILTWMFLFVLIPLTISFFFNLTSVYYTRKTQLLKKQLEEEDKVNQPMSRRTRSQLRASTASTTSLSSEHDDGTNEDSITAQTGSSFRDININTPYSIDPMVFSLTRFALTYFVYTTIVPSIFSTNSDIYPAVNSGKLQNIIFFFNSLALNAKTVKIFLGNILYFDSAFGAIIALYVSSL